jgi:replication-associated recombination protein RarA
MDMFEYMREDNMKKEAPLAARLRPTALAEVVGQQHIIGEGKLLKRAIMADKLGSLIFYGPPGTGKTTLAKTWCLVFMSDQPWSMPMMMVLLCICFVLLQFWYFFA